MDTTFPRLLLQHASQRPGDTAMREKEYGIWQALTWADMATLVEGLACGLHQAGLTRGEHLVVIGANRPRLYATMLAAQSLGAIPIPLYQDAVAAECVFPINNAEVRFALVDSLRALSPAQGFTFVHACHGVVNFVIMHYMAGTPGELQDQGEYNKLTWWEQLDDGNQWTFARKLFIIIPIVLFLFTSHLTDYEPTYLVINLAVLALVLIPKPPQFHRVRLVSAHEE